MDPQNLTPAMRCGPNDGGIKRGDRAGTGDEQARPAKARGAGQPVDDELEELHETAADDGSLGLTNTEGHPPEDWAADTGPTRTPQESTRKTSKQKDDASTLKPR